MRAQTKKKHEIRKRFAVVIGVAAVGVMALGAQTGAQTQAPTPRGQVPLICMGLDATMVGTNDNDSLSGTPAKDVIVGLGGNDTLAGRGGNDKICGGQGNDKLKGGSGNDTLVGQQGKDALLGGYGTDRCLDTHGGDTRSKCENASAEAGVLGGGGQHG
jgi:Ca2+-binding RTX toxin-like protein